MTVSSAEAHSEAHSDDWVHLVRPRKANSLRSRISLPLLSNVAQKAAATANSTDSQGQIIKQDGPFRLLLKVEQSSSGVPVYPNGGVISGSVETSKASSLRSIELRVTGKISTLEIPGRSSPDTLMFSHTFFEWDYGVDPHIPGMIPMNYEIPSKYIDEETGLQYAMPPSYTARLGRIPGFQVRVSYEITAVFTRVREKSSLWRKVTKIHVPFIYEPRHSPQYYNITPPNQLPGTIPSGQKVFVHAMRPRQVDLKPVETRLYLPFGQIYALDEPIPFVVKVFAAPDLLDNFTAAVDPGANLSSFHPISPSTPTQTSCFPTPVPQKVKSSQNQLKPKVELRRTTTVYVGDSGSTVLERSSNIRGRVTLTEGVIYNVTRGSGWIAWSGKIIVPPEVTCGGFSASRLSVSDDIILSILPANLSRSNFLPLCESVPLRLTARSQQISYLDLYSPCSDATAGSSSSSSSSSSPSSPSTSSSTSSS